MRLSSSPLSAWAVPSGPPSSSVMHRRLSLSEGSMPVAGAMANHSSSLRQARVT